MACKTTDPVDPPTETGPGGNDQGGAAGQGGTAGHAGEAGSAGSGGCCTETCQDPPLTNNARKVDLLLMVDNSRNMADKQRVLAEGIEDLVGVTANSVRGNILQRPTPRGASSRFSKDSDRKASWARYARLN